jgi:predicted RNA-binding Zn-ribbon protein involved in translation (DUF1610 family)
MKLLYFNKLKQKLDDIEKLIKDLIKELSGNRGFKITCPYCGNIIEKRSMLKKGTTYTNCEGCTETFIISINKIEDTNKG